MGWRRPSPDSGHLCDRYWAGTQAWAGLWGLLCPRAVKLAKKRDRPELRGSVHADGVACYVDPRPAGIQDGHGVKEAPAFRSPPELSTRSLTLGFLFPRTCRRGTHQGTAEHPRTGTGSAPPHAAGRTVMGLRGTPRPAPQGDTQAHAAHQSMWRDDAIGGSRCKHGSSGTRMRHLSPRPKKE